MSEEYLDIVDESGNVLRTAPRSEIHGNPAGLHMEHIKEGTILIMGLPGTQPGEAGYITEYC